MALMRVQRRTTMSASVPIPVASDGTVGRKCQSCRRYFKVEVHALAGASRLWCPYCGADAERDEFFTLDQRRRIRSAATRLALSEASTMIEQAFRSLKQVRAGPIQIRFETGRIEAPPLLTYLEKETVRERVCGACGSRCAVYGIAVVCPVCGRRDPLEIFVGSLEAARACLVAAGDLPPERHRVLQASGGEDRLAENALRDTVTAFEVYCRARYAEIQGSSALQAVMKTKGPSVFQRLDEAVSIMEGAIGRGMANALSDAEWNELRITFATRHVLTHNFGVSDDRYLANGGTTPLGQRVQVTRTIADRALTLTERLVTAMH